MPITEDGVMQQTAIEEFIESTHIHLLNTPDAEPTFRHGNSIGWSDLTMKQGASLANQCTWEVLEEENHSDHQYLKIHLQTNTDTYSYLRFKTAFGGHSRFIKNFRSHVNIFYTAIVQAQSKQDLDQSTEEL
ncbi:hypothetical protein AVEN_128212-1 [Araneus ventricosus]|uniref:Endonuclease/exonuclease/phosphatase domain-containing protein n=1 Tax=Araneus ventricosus TaxID=182803 RepID=A0A4Y2A062_ARAVE|nr:hypothetical protein AVEN_128212-1 [Araneus ventricosus]